MSTPAAIGWIVAFVLVTVAMTGLGRRIGWPTPLMLVGIGGIASFIPGVPSVHVEAELVLYGLLPPLLFAAARQTYFPDIRIRRDTILILSVGTVAATVVVVGFTAALLLPTIGLAAAFAFAAVVAPTDTVAVTAVAGRIGLPRRVITILEGESLLNDAAALVALNAAILAMAGILTPWSIVGEFVLAVLAGVVLGAVIGWLLSMIRSRIRSAVLDTSLALITPYLAFLAAEAIHGSGILAVVVAGLILGYWSPLIQTAEARTAESVNWRTVQFILENAVFLFIGMNLSGIVAGAARAGYELGTSTLICTVILLALVIARFAFVFTVAWVFRVGPGRLREQNVEWKNALVISSVGVRGVVTLAAVFLLPPDTTDREFLQFLAFVVVVATIFGSTAISGLVRLLHIEPPNPAQERMEAQALLSEVRAAGLMRLEAEISESDDERVVSQLRASSALAASSLQRQHEDPTQESLSDSHRRLRRHMIQAEWEATIKARSQHRYPEAAVIAVLRIIDAEEAAVRTAAEEQELTPRDGRTSSRHQRRPEDDISEERTIP
ncbi:CPA1 family monovalent cation:H+ antiporter [Mycetocola sp. CAN_C7]|uniref:cation:proton antiporter n=1 Tax=Mycetocola sp. CAN_C7 TaxID=2787724 RepID=UPI0018CB5A30